MIVREGWKNEKLGDQLELIRNGYSGKQVDHFTDFPVSRIETISEGKIDMNKVGYVDFIPNSYLLKIGDILISNINSLKHIGKVAQISDGIILFHGMNLLVLRPNENIDHKFLFYKLIASKAWFEKMAAQAINQASINQSTIKELLIELPKEKKEQTKIAEILSTVDRAIEQTEALIVKQQRIKTGLMQDLLTRGIDEHGNLRSEQTHKFKDSPLGRIPVEWEVAHLEQRTIHITKGESPTWQGFAYQSEGILFMTSENVRDGVLDIRRGEKYISPAFHKKLNRSALKRNDVLVNLVGASIARTAIFDLSVKANINQAVCSIRLSDPDNSNWLCACLQLPQSVARLLCEQVETARANLSLRDIRKLKVAFPSQGEQERIGLFISGHERKTLELQLQAAKFRVLKTAIMQDLLTGKNRVKTLLNDMESAL
jgi:type I restriction enzyme, S subunit